ncbi:LysR family transcriptional regulator [Paractinoplanes lichenicola]|uniref:LysR family transcriptional regulator n=1 Tax=Paractinoplanes lichenicola TaxID=2802976 RepID=A0ABS1VP19_9ACTN|nr:LysR family transcriptional regulator [Actinoplanes lichenicola]MBL7255960.1 LysR family transcriptional regulator [Actinoplanes lichenicola]
MDVQQLRCFLAVAEELHFGRAAERLHMTASPVSRIVKELERELGAPLFVRGYHQVELTPAGRALAARVPPLLDQLERARAEVRLIAAGEQRAVHLGGSHFAPPLVLDTVVDCAEKGNPGRPVEVTLAPSADLLPAVSRGELDAALVHLPVDDPAVASLSLASYRFLVVMRRDDPLAGSPALSVADLADRNVVLMPLSLQPLAMQRMRDDLISRGLLRLRMLAGVDSAMLAAHVRRTGDLTFSLDPSTGGSARMYDDPAFAVVPLTDFPQFRLGLVWLAERAADPVVRGVVEAVRTAWADGEWEI